VKRNAETMLVLMRNNGTIRKILYSKFEEANKENTFETEIIFRVNTTDFTLIMLNNKEDIEEIGQQCVLAESMGLNRLTEELFI
jgi:hypothetical protein